MEPKYTTEMTMTEEEYLRYADAVTNSRKKSKVLIIILSVLLMMLSAVWFWMGRFIMGGIVLVAAVSYPIWFRTARRKQLKRIFASGKSGRALTNHLQFYEDHLVTENEDGRKDFPYTDILDILETPTNFYLMLAANSGIIVSKSNCTEGLVSFLQEMKAEKLAAQK